MENKIPLGFRFQLPSLFSFGFWLSIFGTKMKSQKQKPEAGSLNSEILSIFDEHVGT